MSFRSIAKHLSGIILKPATKFYLTKERRYTYKGIDVQVRPNVFHPGLFFSTKILLKYLQTINVKGKNCLELGCGSGLISCYLSKQEAIVTASDISANAIENTKINARLNKSPIKTILSDLFEAIPKTTYDYVIINPPFYLQNPQSEKDFAWYAGENGSYFVKLFSQLNEYLYPNTQVILILSDECAIDFITSEANKNKLQLRVILETKKIWDKFFIYQVSHINK